MPAALIVDDNLDTLDALAELVRAEGFSASTAPTIERARVLLSRETPDVVLLDVNLPDGTGLSLLDGLKAPSVVLITGHASVETAVEALRHGVTDYLTKPLDVERLRRILVDIARTSSLPDEIRTLRSQQDQIGRFGLIVGRSAAILRTCELIGRIAPSSASVLVTGESGTGKDVVARTIHDLSRRRHGPFVPVNCGAVSPTLMESELFGHERGSFTGADRRHRGFFERAHKGTLFLDEITEMPVELQVKLLRVLESGVFPRVGGEEQIAVDVRIVAASNRDVSQAIAQGRLREDLFYRLRVFELALPPLRERPDDVEPLTQHFLDDLFQKEGTRKGITPDALRRLAEYAWPGNVRELRNVVQSAYILSGDVIDVPHLPDSIRSGSSWLSREEAAADGESVLRVMVGTSLAEVERRLIVATLKRCQGDKTAAAQILGISLKTLYNRLNAYRSAETGSLSGDASGAASEAVPADGTGLSPAVEEGRESPAPAPVTQPIEPTT